LIACDASTSSLRPTGKKAKSSRNQICQLPLTLFASLALQETLSKDSYSGELRRAKQRRQIPRL
jgi:hypothetical protein